MPRYQSIQAKRPGAVGGGGLRAADAAGTSPGAVAGGGATVGAVNLQARYHSVIGVGKPISAAAGGAAARRGETSQAANLYIRVNIRDSGAGNAE